MKKLKEYVFLIPAVIFFILTGVGMYLNIPVFPIIKIPVVRAGNEEEKNAAPTATATGIDTENGEKEQEEKLKTNSGWRDGVYSGVK